MSGLTDLMVGAVRLKILELLRATNGYSLNHEMIGLALGAMGIRLSGDQLRADLAWLGDVRVVRINQLQHLTIAELTERGHDVAKGLSEIRGIDRPIPGAGL